MKGKIFPSIVTHLSFRRMASLLLVGAAAIAFQGVAYAHNLTVTSATPGCNGSQIVINFTITSWDVGSVLGGPPESAPLWVPTMVRTATSWSSLMEGRWGVLLRECSWIRPTVSRGRPTHRMAPKLVNVTAQAVATWGDGFGGGQISDGFPVDLSNTSCGTTHHPETDASQAVEKSWFRMRLSPPAVTLH